ncbi:uncharacterized protein LOC130802861 isoform X2 [Amaranthus tricolor]|uniref:uncharacterized protein LOC130802861 isoform X2 n=1 Tax=Amaranthus tricolor TaxID=29722 RepID=UPI002587285C|nr:uncharacterized protein LOC130802861 isoform X2 [Amaranthus tricolor]
MMGNRGPEERNKTMQLPHRIQQKVCYICGHRGFEDALMCCPECLDSFVHQYCLGIAPGSIDDTFDWFCEYCSPPIAFEDKNFRGDVEDYHNEKAIVSIIEEVEPLCILPPSMAYISSKRKEFSDKYQAGTSSIIMSHSLTKQPDSLVSPFMENPKEIMSGLVLLTSRSGEITIHALDSQIAEDTSMTGSIFVGHPMNCNILPLIGCECKRPRTKRRRISCSSSKNALASKLTISSVSAIGDEESGQTIDGQEVLMSRKTVNETSQAHKYLEIPFVMNGLCAVAATQGCAVSKSMIGTCRSDLRLNDDQEMGIGLFELGIDPLRIPYVLNRESSTYLRQGAKALMSMKPSFSPRECEVDTKIEMKALNEDNQDTLQIRDVSNFGALDSSFVKSIVESKPSFCATNLTSGMVLNAVNRNLMEYLAMTNEPREQIFSKIDKLQESITYLDVWKEYDVEIQKLKSELEGEKEKLQEVIKKHRRSMWKVIFELETTKKELKRKIDELSIKTMQVEMVKDLGASKASMLA